MSLKIEATEDWVGEGNLRFEEGATRPAMIAGFEESRAALAGVLGKQGGHVSDKLMRRFVDEYLRPHWFARVRGFVVDQDAKDMDVGAGEISGGFHYRIGIAPGEDGCLDAGTADAHAMRGEDGSVRPRFRALLMAGAECGSCDGNGTVEVDCDAPGCPGHEVECCACDGEGKVEAVIRDVFLADLLAALPEKEAGALQSKLHEMTGRQLVMFG